jgi:thioredoxin reductase (NADPH)
MLDAPLVVIGAGPGGCAAAVQSARLGVRPRLFDRAGRAGGLVANAREVENYPGPEAPLSGRLFAARLGEYLSRFGLSVEPGTVEAIEPATVGPRFLLRGSFGELAARAVIVAVGTAPRRLGIPGEAELAGTRLFFEVNDLLPAPPPQVVVIGGGEAAFDYALSLVDAGARVILCIRSGQPTSRGRLAEQVGAEPRIVLLPRTEVLEVRRHGGEVVVDARTPEGPRSVTGGAVLVAVGRQSAAGPLLGREGRRPGLFVIGDARLGALGQTGMAVGDGLGAAAAAVEFLEREA